MSNKELVLVTLFFMVPARFMDRYKSISVLYLGEVTFEPAVVGFRDNESAFEPPHVSAAGRIQQAFHCESGAYGVTILQTTSDLGMGLGNTSECFLPGFRETLLATLRAFFACSGKHKANPHSNSRTIIGLSRVVVEILRLLHLCQPNQRYSWFSGP